MTISQDPQVDLVLDEPHPAVDARVEQVLDRSGGLFTSFHRARLSTFARRLDRLIDSERALEGGTLDEDSVVRRAVADLLTELSELSGRALIAAFHEYREQIGRPVDPNSHDAFARFEQRMGESGFAATVERDWPVLTRLLDEACRRRLVLIEEILVALRADRADLAKAALLPAGPITAIAISSGDAHHEGRRVAIVRGPDASVVYKPRDLTLERTFGAAVALIAPHLDPGRALRLPRLVATPGRPYGWQEFVAPESMSDFSQIPRHRYRLGAFLALFAALGSTDLHLENLISHGEYPMFIDLETALQHRLTTPGDSARLQAPLLETMLLPMRVAGVALDVDLSGIGSLGAQTSSLLNYSVLDPATDAMRFEQAAFEVTHGDNLARLGGVPVPPKAGVDALIAGFRDSLEAVRREREPLLALFRETAAPVRQVVRPTHVYARFLAASTHPRYLADPQQRRELFAKMARPAGVADAAGAALSALEVAALDRHDVPYFTGRIDSGDLFTPGDGPVRDAFDEPLYRQVEASMADLLESPVRRHEHTIRMSLATTECELALSGRDADAEPGAYSSELVEPGRIAETIADFLRDTAYPVGRQRVWLLPSLDGPLGQQRLVFRPGDVSLYEGGGVPLLLAALAADHAGRPDSAELAALAHGALPEDSATAPPGDPRGLSVFAGRSGWAFLCHELAVHLGDPELLAVRDESIRELAATPIDDHHEVDIVGGYSGTAAFLAALADAEPEHPSSAAIEGFLSDATRRLAAVLRSGRLPEGELAHGDLGVAWSLARSAAQVGDRAALAQARAVLHRHAAAVGGVARGRPRVGEASWCKGTAGSLLALAEALPLTGGDPAGVATVLEPLVARSVSAALGHGRDLTPCHGVTGLVHALLRAGTLLERPDWTDLAGRVLEERGRRVVQEGYGGGLSGSGGFVGYMLGLTGLAHTELLLRHPSWGSPLWLAPTPRSR